MTTPTLTREALIAWHRAMQEVCRDSDGTAFLNHRDTADMLAADACLFDDLMIAYTAGYAKGTDAGKKSAQRYDELSVAYYEVCADLAVAKRDAQQVAAPQARELSDELADERLAEMAAMAVWEEEP